MNDLRRVLALLSVGTVLVFLTAVLTVHDVGTTAAWASDYDTVRDALVAAVFVVVVAGLAAAVRNG